MNKRFFVYFYLLFCVIGGFFCVVRADVTDSPGTDTSGTGSSATDVSQISLHAFKNEIFAEFNEKKEKLEHKINDLEVELESLKFEPDSHKQVKSKIESAKHELATVQKKMDKLERIFKKHPSSISFEWRKYLFYSIHITVIASVGLLMYKVFRKIQIDPDPNDRKWAMTLATSLIGAYLLIQFFLYYFSGDVAVALSDAEKLDPEKYAHVYKMLEELCKKANIPTSSLFIMDETTPNAFASGPLPSSSCIVMSNGLLDLLNENELKSVLSHELSHVKNYDILTDTLLGMLFVPMYFFAVIVKHSHDKGYNEKISSRDILDFILYRTIGTAMEYSLKFARLFVSRSVEYRADQEGAALCEEPLALASALYKTRRHLNTSFFKKNSVKNDPNFIESFLELFSTHPLDKNRIEELKALDRFYREKMHRLVATSVTE